VVRWTCFRPAPDCPLRSRSPLFCVPFSLTDWFFAPQLYVFPPPSGRRESFQKRRSPPGPRQGPRDATQLYFLPLQDVRSHTFSRLLCPRALCPFLSTVEFRPFYSFVLLSAPPSISSPALFQHISFLYLERERCWSFAPNFNYLSRFILPSPGKGPVLLLSLQVGRTTNLMVSWPSNPP